MQRIEISLNETAQLPRVWKVVGSNATSDEGIK